MKTMAIVNPASANGRTGKLWPSLQMKLEAAIGSFDFEFTEKQKPASVIASSALKHGFERLVSVGGDGTLSETVNGYFANDKPVNPKAVLAFIMHGTGGDFKKTFDMRGNYDTDILRLMDNNIRPVDIGKITSTNAAQKKATRYFINIASFGMGGQIVENMNHIKFLKLFGGKAAFYIVTLLTMLTYKNRLVQLQMNDETGEPDKIVETKIRNVAIANARFHGGGMMIAPDAQIDDGLLDVVVLGDMNFLQTLSLSGRIYRGKHPGHPLIKTYKTKRVSVKSWYPLTIDADGDVFGSLPASFEVIPRALRLQV
ncbi:MAG: diacylglycerol kinase family lipid kinase [Spirochaetia bacterium]|nr:diacylglycerol kinase family lipid kinase [Spirochaetia bacterium]